MMEFCALSALTCKKEDLPTDDGNIFKFFSKKYGDLCSDGAANGDFVKFLPTGLGDEERKRRMIFYSELYVKNCITMAYAIRRQIRKCSHIEYYKKEDMFFEIDECLTKDELLSRIIDRFIQLPIFKGGITDEERLESICSASLKSMEELKSYSWLKCFPLND